MNYSIMSSYHHDLAAYILGNLSLKEEALNIAAFHEAIAIRLRVCEHLDSNGIYYSEGDSLVEILDTLKLTCPEVNIPTAIFDNKDTLAQWEEASVKEQFNIELSLLDSIYEAVDKLMSELNHKHSDSFDDAMGILGGN